MAGLLPLPPVLLRSTVALHQERAYLTFWNLNPFVIDNSIPAVHILATADAPGLTVLLTPPGGAAITLAVEDSRELGLYVLEGVLASAGAGPLGAGELAVLTPGMEIVLAADGAGPVTVALIGGQPVEGPILFAGPFVMDTPERLQRAREDFLAGRMGRLEGVPF